MLYLSATIVRLSMKIQTLSKAFALSTIVSTMALSGQAYAEMYIEGSLGVVSVDDVSTIPYSGSGNGITVSNLRGTLSYDNANTYGFEIGQRVTPNLRIGLGYSSYELQWKTVTGSGTISDGTTTVNLATTLLTRGQLSDDTVLDNRVNTLMVSAYYDLETTGRLRPFIGAGIGQADIENAVDKELAISFSLGAQYDVSETTYVGFKYSRFNVDGPTDKAGFQYEDVTADAFAVTYGIRF